MAEENSVPKENEVSTVPILHDPEEDTATPKIIDANSPNLERSRRYLWRRIWTTSIALLAVAGIIGGNLGLIAPATKAVDNLRSSIDKFLNHPDLHPTTTPTIVLPSGDKIQPTLTSQAIRPSVFRRSGNRTGFDSRQKDRPSVEGGPDKLTASAVVEKAMPRIDVQRNVYMDFQDEKIILILTCPEDKIDQCKYLPVTKNTKDPKSYLAEGQLGSWGDHGKSYRFVLDATKTYNGTRYIWQTDLWARNLKSDLWHLTSNGDGTFQAIDDKGETYSSDYMVNGRLEHQRPSKIKFVESERSPAPHSN